MRTLRKYPFSLTETSKKRFLLWAQQFDEIVWLDSNNYSQAHQTYQAILAVDAFTALKIASQNAFGKLKEYQNTTKDWLFGYLSYDLKNDVENLKSNNYDGLNFPDLYFFQPKKLFLFSEEQVEIQYLNLVADELEEDWKTISNLVFEPDAVEAKSFTIQARTSKNSYLEKVNEMLAILVGAIFMKPISARNSFRNMPPSILWKLFFGLTKFQNHLFPFF